MPINLQSYLERSISNNHLILTVPFIIEFLSMMDPNAYFIDSIKNTISILIMIF
jgi:codanin-1